MEVNLKACKKSNGSEGNHFSLLVCHLNICRIYWNGVYTVWYASHLPYSRRLCAMYTKRVIFMGLSPLFAHMRESWRRPVTWNATCSKQNCENSNQTHFMYVSLKLIASWIFRFICSSYAWLCVYLCFVEWVGWSIMLFFVSFMSFSFLYFSTSSNQSTCMLETFSVWFSFGVLFVGLDRVHVS